MTPQDAAKVASVLRVCDGFGTVGEAHTQSGLSVGQVTMLSGITRERVTALIAGEPRTLEEHRLLTLLFDVPRFVDSPPEGHAREVRQCRDCCGLWFVGERQRHSKQCVLAQSTRRGPL